MRETKRTAGSGAGSIQLIPAALIPLAFVSSGAWFITQLPPIPIAKALDVATVGIWLLAAGFALFRLARPDRRVLIAIGVVAASISVSFVLGGSLPEVAVYDLYGNMSLLQWLTFPAMFLLAASMGSGVSTLRRGLYGVVAAAALLGLVMAIQTITTGATSVFGSTSYSVPALACAIPLAFGLAGSAKGADRMGLYAAGAVLTAALGVFSGSMTGSVAAAFAVVVSVAVHPGLQGTALRSVWVRAVALGLAGLMAVALLAAQLPFLTGRWVNADTLSGFDKNVITRVYLWEGAQQMVAERPIFGFGPSGYRLYAAEYLPVEVHELGPGSQGDIDPTAYSPQSPHSVVWDIATRLGLLGLAAFVGLFVVWGLVLRTRVREDAENAPLRMALAAGFASTLFALLVNPSIFAIGLLAPVLAGVAVAPFVGEADATRGKKGRSIVPADASKRLRVVLGTLGVFALLFAVWTGTGEMLARGTGTDDATTTLQAYRDVLGIIPGYPQTVRQTLELGLLTAADGAALADAQAAVEAAPAHVAEFAPNLVSIATYSLTQADRTGRTDVAWERGLLDRASGVLPMIPSLAGERLHVALIEGDPATIQAALADAERWGGAYALTEGYIQRAQEVTASGQ